jgi:beta-lactamase regulating signal transducer with metallopeptidase domain
MNPAITPDAAAVESAAEARPQERPQLGASAPVPSVRRALSTGALALTAWALGTALMLSSLAVSLLSLARLTRTSVGFRAGRVTALTDELRAALGIRRSVTLLQGETGVMPMSWGLRDPVILLPVEAERWHRSRLISVLLHELAHVRRRDCLTQILAEVVLALHWLNPLAWLAARRLRVEREHACDDVVVASGARPSEYAEELLSLARAFHPARGSSLAAVAMARPTHLAARLRAVLEERTRRALSRTGAAVIALSGAAALITIAGFTPARIPSSSETSSAPHPGSAPAPEVVTSASASAAATPALSPTEPSAVAEDPTSAASEVEKTPELEKLQALRELIPPRWMTLVSRWSPLQPQQPSCGMATEGWRQTNVSSDDDSHRLTWSRPGCQVQVRIEGDVEFSNDLRDVSRLGEGAFLRIEEEDGGTDRRLDIRPGADGAPLYEYRLDGDVRPFDAAARSWFEALLVQVYRRAGFMAPERVSALLRSGGVQGVLQELELLTSDYVFALYTRELLAQADLADAQAVDLLGRAQVRVESDHYMAEILEAVAANRLGSDAVLGAFVSASRTVESDHYRAQVLTRALQRTDLSAEQVAAVLESAAEIASDHYLAELLGAIAARYALQPAMRASYLRAAESIESDHYRAQVLSGLLQRSDLEAGELAVVLRAARGLESDHYATEVLQRVAQRDLSSDELMGAYLEVSNSVESDHYRGEALKSLLDRENVAGGQLLGVIRAASGIASDHYKADVLLEVVQRFRPQGATRAALIEAINSIGSGHYRGQVAEALLRAGPGY